MSKEDQSVEVENEETEEVETQTTEKMEGEEKGDLIPKSEAQKMVDKALAKKLPPKEEMDAFKKWKEDQKTEAERLAEKEKEFMQTQDKLNATQRENLALKKAVKADELDYVLYKVSRMDGDFEENLDKFIDENPKFVQATSDRLVVGGEKPEDTDTPTNAKFDKMAERMGLKPEEL